MQLPELPKPRFGLSLSEKTYFLPIYQYMGIEWVFTPHRFLIRGESISPEFESYNALPINSYLNCYGLRMPRFDLIIGS